MRQTMIAATAALALGAAASVQPAFASDSGHAAQHLVNQSVPVVRQIKQQPHFDALLKQAKGVFIMPTHVKGALGIGGAGGQGVLLARGANGGWSDPAFLTLGSISLGAQAGGKAGPTVMLLMTDKALNDFTQANNFSLNANAGLTIVDYSAQGQAPVGKGDVIIWSNDKGAFAGADVSATDITVNKGEDKAFYGRSVSATQILHGQVTSPKAAKLRTALPL